MQAAYSHHDGSTMKAQMATPMRVRIALLAFICVAVPSLTGGTEPAPVRNCTWCHGTSLNGFATAPQLAGQQPQYIFNQLRGFHRQTRDNPFSRQFMWGAAENLTPATAYGLATYLSALPPRPADDGNRELAGAGRSLYEEGDPDGNIVACAACHGPNAEGQGDIPRLGGLSYAYLKRRLEQWGEGYHASALPPMPRIAAKLAPTEIEALASYLSFVR
jgi:cytochrome c553